MLFQKKGSFGFTLIELVMVIAIIGILSAIALPKFFDLQTSAKIAATKGSLGAVRSALAIKYAMSATGGGSASFPSSLTGTDFSDGQAPKNALSGVSGIAALGATTTGVATSATNGFWYVSLSTNADYGRAGAYSDALGANNTSNY